MKLWKLKSPVHSILYYEEESLFKSQLHVLYTTVHWKMCIFTNALLALTLLYVFSAAVDVLFEVKVSKDFSFCKKNSKRMEKRWKDGDSDIGMRAMNDERRTSRRLRTTVSAHRVVFPSISSSVSLPPSFWLHSNFSSSVLFFVFFSLLLFLGLPALPLCMFLSLHFQSTYLYSLCFYSCLFAASHLFFWSACFNSPWFFCIQLRAYSYGIYCMYNFTVRLVKISVNWGNKCKTIFIFIFKLKIKFRHRNFVGAP